MKYIICISKCKGTSIDSRNQRDEAADVSVELLWKGGACVQKDAAALAVIKGFGVS